MNKFLLPLLVWSSLGVAAPHCSFEFDKGLFFEAHVDDSTHRISMSGPHQSYEAPYARSSNPEETTYYAVFGKNRALELTENQSGRKICLSEKCFPCK